MPASDDLEAQALRLIEGGDEAVREAIAALEGDARDVLVGAIGRARAKRALEEADARLEENADGTIIVRLLQPVTLSEATVHRLTVGRVKVQHVRQARGHEEELDFYADALVEPGGAVGELEADRDYVAVIRAVERQLGKFRASGARS